MGRFEYADKATIFLDEIGDLPLETQAMLLRVLQDGEFEKVGSSKTIQVDVRVIAATNRDLRLLVNEKKFRQDLFFRLNVFPIEIPPLRELQNIIEHGLIISKQDSLEVDCLFCQSSALKERTGLMSLADYEKNTSSTSFTEREERFTGKAELPRSSA